MNKKSWITVKLDDTIKIEKIEVLIENSYNISLVWYNKNTFT